jgi:hypothetical protein
VDVLMYAPKFNELMDKYGVDFVLAGHDHIYSRSYNIYDNKVVGDIDYYADSVTNPQGTLYFTMTTASGLKYYDFLTTAPASPAWVKSIEGLDYEGKNTLGTLTGKPWYTNIGIQYKVPQFTVVDVTATSVTFRTFRVDNMASPIDEYTVSKLAPTVDASVKQLNGNKNELTITVVEQLNGKAYTVSATFSINNNVANTYTVGSYNDYVDTKGNTQIRACYFV